MIKYIIREATGISCQATVCVILLLMGISPLLAQSPKKDTVVLSVYNNSQRFMLYPMPFGKDRPDRDFTAEMVVALDTINVLETATRADTSGKYPKRWITKRKGNKLPTNVKDKVAVLYLNKDFDISTQVLNAQEAGALAVIIIHSTDNRDSVALPKKSATVKYANDNKIKIPCFTVRKGIGEKLTTMMPSLVGIQRPKTDVGTIQTLITPTMIDSINRAKQAQADSTAQAEYAKYLASQEFTEKGWQVSPNPADGEVVLHYNLERRATVNIDIFNEIGQIVTNYQLPDTQSGKLTIDVSSWQGGAYNVSLRSGSLREVKRLMVVH
jgi:Secretion system C-terminal sorting domain/PA domain